MHHHASRAEGQVPRVAKPTGPGLRTILLHHASLAVTLGKAGTAAFADYAAQVLRNALVMAQSLLEREVREFCRGFPVPGLG